jgi:hypothetical protein
LIADLAMVLSANLVTDISDLSTLAPAAEIDLSKLRKMRSTPSPNCDAAADGMYG